MGRWVGWGYRDFRTMEQPHLGFPGALRNGNCPESLPLLPGPCLRRSPPESLPQLLPLSHSLPLASESYASSIPSEYLFLHPRRKVTPGLAKRTPEEEPFSPVLPLLRHSTAGKHTHADRFRRTHTAMQTPSYMESTMEETLKRHGQNLPVQEKKSDRPGF